MGLSADVKIIAKRAEFKIRENELLIAGIKNEVARLNASINKHSETIASAHNHLSTFTLAGDTSLAEILESKARQATVKRKIATMTMQIEELIQQVKVRNRDLEQALGDKKMLLRKADKLDNFIDMINKQLAQKKARQLDNDLEEQLQWKR